MLLRRLDETATVDVARRSGSAAETLALAPRPDGAIVIEPWPFARDEVRLAIEGRRLDRTFGDQDDLDAALREAPSIAIETVLRRR